MQNDLRLTNQTFSAPTNSSFTPSDSSRPIPSGMSSESNIFSLDRNPIIFEIPEQSTCFGDFCECIMSIFSPIKEFLMDIFYMFWPFETEDRNSFRGFNPFRTEEIPSRTGVEIDSSDEEETSDSDTEEVSFSSRSNRGSTYFQPTRVSSSSRIVEITEASLSGYKQNILTFVENWLNNAKTHFDTCTYPSSLFVSVHLQAKSNALRQWTASAESPLKQWKMQKALQLFLNPSYHLNISSKQAVLRKEQDLSKTCSQVFDAATIFLLEFEAKNLPNDVELCIEVNLIEKKNEGFSIHQYSCTYDTLETSSIPDQRVSSKENQKADQLPSELICLTLPNSPLQSYESPPVDDEENFKVLDYVDDQTRTFS